MELGKNATSCCKMGHLVPTSQRIILRFGLSSNLRNQNRAVTVLSFAGFNPEIINLMLSNCRQEPVLWVSTRKKNSAS
jgi:hypothetical protein